MKKIWIIAMMTICIIATPLRASANADNVPDGEESMTFGDFDNFVSGDESETGDRSTDPTFKKITVPITKEYESCEFKITYENPGNYSTTVLSPKGKEYKASQNTQYLSTSKIDGVGTGEWIIRIISNDGVPVGKVKVDVSAVSKNRTQVVDEVPVAKDINGLQIYFKNDSIVAEWSDTSVGGVHVVVYNTKNQVTIANEKVSAGANYFEAQLPSDIEQVTISLVPTASEGFEEAETLRTFTVNNHPNAYVTFPNITYTNKDEIDVDVKLNDNYGVEIVNNGLEQEKIPSKEPGTYTYSVKLEEGSNSIEIYVVDQGGNKRSSQTEIIRDTVPPVLILNESYTDVSTYEETYTITGNARDFLSITIDGYEVEARSNGDFSFDVPLYPGVNNIDIVVTDQAGNTANYSANITMLVKEEKSVPISTFIILGLIIGFAAILLLLKKMGFLQFHSKNDTVNNDHKITGKKKESKSAGGNIKGRESQKKETPAVKKEKQEKRQKMKCKNKSERKLNIDHAYYACLPAVALFLISFAFYNAVVPSASMEPTLNVGDAVIMNRLAYMVREPERGDIVIFKNNGRTALGNNDILIKRIIGMPGETVSFKDGRIFIDGKICEEDYLAYDTETNPLEDDEIFEVPENSYFLLGDNRGDSMDSRYWSNPYVGKDELIAKYLYSFHLPDKFYNLIQAKNGKINISKSSDNLETVTEQSNEPDPIEEVETGSVG